MSLPNGLPQTKGREQFPAHSTRCRLSCCIKYTMQWGANSFCTTSSYINETEHNPPSTYTQLVGVIPLGRFISFKMKGGAIKKYGFCRICHTHLLRMEHLFHNSIGQSLYYFCNANAKVVLLKRHL